MDSENLCGTEPLVPILRNALDSMEYADLKIVCRNGTARAHRSVLYAASSLFRTLCSSCTCSKCEMEEIIVPDVSLRSMRKFLTLIYSGQLSRPEETEDMEEVCSIASMFGINSSRLIQSDDTVNPDRFETYEEMTVETEVEFNVQPKSYGLDYSPEARVNVEPEMCEYTVITSPSEYHHPPTSNGGYWYTRFEDGCPKRDVEVEDSVSRDISASALNVDLFQVLEEGSFNNKDPSEDILLEGYSEDSERDLKRHKMMNGSSISCGDKGQGQGIHSSYVTEVPVPDLGLKEKSYDAIYSNGYEDSNKVSLKREENKTEEEKMKDELMEAAKYASEKDHTYTFCHAKGSKLRQKRISPDKRRSLFDHNYSHIT